MSHVIFPAPVPTITAIRWNAGTSDWKTILPGGGGRFRKAIVDAQVALEIQNSIITHLAARGVLDDRHCPVQSIFAIGNEACAQAQRLHTDYEPSHYPSVAQPLFRDARTMPLGALWAVNDTFGLRTKHGLISVPRGHMLVFTHDFLHGGCGGETQSSKLRFHAYLLPRLIKRVVDVVHFAEGDAYKCSAGLSSGPYPDDDD